MSTSPKVLMFGWEYPPFNSGGLGTACYGLTHGLADNNIDVTFVLPHKVKATSKKVRIAFADQREVSLKTLQVLSNPYISTELYQTLRRTFPENDIISNDLITAVYKYSINARKIAQENDCDIIHAHDWLSFGAGMEARQLTKKPLVLHVHATEFDRTGFNHVHPHIYQIEQEGMKRSDKVIAVSGYTKDIIVKHYGIPWHKVDVVHNGINLQDYKKRYHDVQQIKQFFGKIILFVGRLTLQKGADYFLEAAHKVLQHYTNVSFIIGGAGDAQQQLMEQAARYSMTHKVFFTGFLRGEELNKVYQAADLFVMPSVSEPFGIAALEALANGTPVMVSHQSGVSEVVTNALKVNFWDTNDMANKMLAVLQHSSLHDCLQTNAIQEIPKFSWHESAKKCAHIYQQLLA